MLALASAAFLATHFVSSTPLRPAVVAKIGEWPYVGAYSAVALLTLGWMAWAYAQAPRQPVFSGSREIAYVLMPIAFVLLACGFYRNPTIVGFDKLISNADPARGIIRVTRHPIMWGFILWAAAHVLARGDLKSLIFFGTFIVMAGVGTLAMDARKRANPDWARFAALTSHVPLLAILGRKNRLVWREIGWLRPAIGLAVYFAVLSFHP